MNNRIVLVLALVVAPLQADLSRLPITLVSLGRILGGMPRVLASPHDTRAVLGQMQCIRPYVQTLSALMHMLMSPDVRNSVAHAPHKQVMHTLELAGDVADQAELYDGGIPGLMKNRPF